MTILAYSLVQPAVVVHDLDAAGDRMFALFKAVPSEKNNSDAFRNAVYAFDNWTYLEVLDGMHEGHTRGRFLEQFGPGMYMLCVDLANTDPDEVDSGLETHGVRVVAPGRQTENVQRGWHLHPRDAGNILTLITVKKDRTDNTDWAGHQAAAYVQGNTRVVTQLRGVVARTPDPAAEAGAFANVGFPMEPLGPAGALRWTGATGTVLELHPADAWPGGSVESRRDYALCFTVPDLPAAIEHFRGCGLDGAPFAGDRWLSEVDPILGVRLVLEPEPARA